MTLNAESCILSVIFAEYCLRRLPQISLLYWMSLCWMSWRLKSNICTWLAHLWTLNSKGCLLAMLTNKRPGNTNWRRRRLCTVDLLVPTSLDQLLWNWKHYLFSYKTRSPLRSSTVLSLSLLLVFPDVTIIQATNTLA